ncbi:MAG: pyocin knob domain-containing protein [Bacteroidota bacterium]
MKKIYTTLIAILTIVQLANAQSTPNTNGNLNSISGNGNYAGYNLTNSPSGNGWVMTSTFSNGSDQLFQLAYDQYQSGKLFTRYSASFGSSWSAWKVIINSDALSGNANYLAKFTGTNSTGNSSAYDDGAKVGIGTNTPDEVLTVNGKIHAKEVRIDTSIPTPDYVFNKDYPLMSLTEVKNYIEKNHHLPEVPSAAEVEKDGLRLGEMNIILLKNSRRIDFAFDRKR